MAWTCDMIKKLKFHSASQISFFYKKNEKGLDDKIKYHGPIFLALPVITGTLSVQIN